MARPEKTRQTRYRITWVQNPAVTDILDVYEQTHGLQQLGERTSYSIPPGAAAGFPGGAILQYDPMGNVKSIQLNDGVSMTSVFAVRASEHAGSLAPPASNPKILRRKYAYRDGGRRHGQLLEMKALIVDPVTSGSVVVAGTRVGYNNSLQVRRRAASGRVVRHPALGLHVRRSGRLAGFITAASASGMPPFATRSRGLPERQPSGPMTPTSAHRRFRVPALDCARPRRSCRQDALVGQLGHRRSERAGRAPEGGSSQSCGHTRHTRRDRPRRR